MANPQHIEILLKGSNIWNEWRQKNSLVFPNLSGANLEGANLSQFNFEQASLRKINLRGAKLRGTNFKGANFNEADLREADLRDADLTYGVLKGGYFDGANFSEANLAKATLIETLFVETNFVKANLRGANLRKANFREANLREANLRETDLREANLEQTVLIEANLYGANLNFTNLSNSIFVDTIVSNVDLSSVQGLESIIHYGPSEVGINTLFLSRGRIPEVFLRGCGVPEEFITYIPAFTNRPIEFYSCFISYNHTDAIFARQLHDFLQGRGIRCWLAEKQLIPGHDIHDEVDRGIKLWDKTLLCASKASLTSWWVDKEITHTFAKEKKLMETKGKKIRALIPLDLDGFLFDGWESSDADEVRRRLAADFIGWESDNQKMQKQFERVLKALRADEGREIPPKSRH